MPSQVYSAEEKRALALFNYEEKAAREARLMAEFRSMLDAKAAAAAAAAANAAAAAGGTGASEPGGGGPGSGAGGSA